MGRRSQADARQARKFERATRHTHSVQAGPSIVEMMEERLWEVAAKWDEARTEAKAVKENPAEADFDVAGQMVRLRGELRGLAISIALIRHPLRRYETAWWGYVKKLEKRAVAKARSSVDPE